MFQFLSSLVGGPSKPAQSKITRQSCKPSLEGLEDRRLLAASLVGGNIVINQSSLNDTAVVTNTTKSLGFFQLPAFKVQETIGGFALPAKTFFAFQVTGRILYHGGAGNDLFDNLTNLKSTAFGDAGNDILRGGHNADILDGGDGNDELHGREGNDLMFGGNGNDVMRGGQGDDRMFGGNGFDDMFGADGNDFLDGGRDGVADKLTGGTGADTFVSEPVRILFFTFNRDKPQDFNAAQGDKII